MDKKKGVTEGNMKITKDLIERTVAYWGDIVYPVGVDGKKLKEWNKVVSKAKRNIKKKEGLI